MLYFPRALAAWSSQGFTAVFKAEMEAQNPDDLPLQAALAHTSQVSDRPLGATVLAVEATPERIRVKVGLFFAGIIAGCSCADDPTPVDEISEYCEGFLEIHRADARGIFTLLDD